MEPEYKDKGYPDVGKTLIGCLTFYMLTGSSLSWRSRGQCHGMVCSEYLFPFVVNIFLETFAPLMQMW
jgi:hypothetical protein